VLFAETIVGVGVSSGTVRVALREGGGAFLVPSARVGAAIGAGIVVGEDADVAHATRKPSVNTKIVNRVGAFMRLSFSV
jgi:hypothetical protein